MGGKGELDELGRPCESEEVTAIRETLEESSVLLDKSQLIKVWTEFKISSQEWVAEKYCPPDKATHKIRRTVFIYPVNLETILKQTEPENASEWKWYTYDEAIQLPLIPMIKQPLNYIFNEIHGYYENGEEKYYNNLEQHIPTVTKQNIALKI